MDDNEPTPERDMCGNCRHWISTMPALPNLGSCLIGDGCDPDRVCFDDHCCAHERAERGTK